MAEKQKKEGKEKQLKSPLFFNVRTTMPALPATGEACTNDNLPKVSPSTQARLGKASLPRARAGATGRAFVTLSKFSFSY